MSILKNSLV